jgi:hypothetical protein
MNAVLRERMVGKCAAKQAFAAAGGWRDNEPPRLKRGR